MAETGLVQIIEGALLAAGKPLTVTQLAELFEEGERPSKDDIRAALEDVAARCEDRGFELKEVASGFRFQVRQNLGPWVARLWHERPPKYSRALLETLALIAYRQPITRGEIEEIRGVAVSSNIIKTLHEREWIRVVGHRDVPGRPAMYATTRQFLDYFNLKSLDQLPALAEIRDLETLNAELGFSEPLESAANDGAGEAVAEEGDGSAEPAAAEVDEAAAEDGAAAVPEAGADDAVAAAGDVDAGAGAENADSGADNDNDNDSDADSDADSHSSDADDDSSEDAAGAQRADG